MEAYRKYLQSCISAVTFKPHSVLGWHDWNMLDKGYRYKMTVVGTTIASNVIRPLYAKTLDMCAALSRDWPKATFTIIDLDPDNPEIL